eukprot:196536-Prorocentrum_lima.AAC.1
MAPPTPRFLRLLEEEEYANEPFNAGVKRWNTAHLRRQHHELGGPAPNPPRTLPRKRRRQAPLLWLLR